MRRRKGRLWGSELRECMSKNPGNQAGGEEGGGNDQRTHASKAGLDRVKTRTHMNPKLHRDGC